ncbi:hypothetical protein [Laspinema olomoucense]|uniref:hypothetical protein n=1 Tax=Laspinema olomoucense TaxID=3231600 RepID=UPI0021BA924C|nr:hypothetical protein [Laspinema sp. D3a]MCT7988814.1 hypothetical protein [Laspinema sp. D3a]
MNTKLLSVRSPQSELQKEEGRPRTEHRFRSKGYGWPQRNSGDRLSSSGALLEFENLRRFWAALSQPSVTHQFSLQNSGIA